MISYRHAVQTDIFEWHFVMRGPADSEFEVRRGKAKKETYCCETSHEHG